MVMVVDEVYEKSVNERDSIYDKYGIDFEDIKDLTALDAHVFKIIESGHTSLIEIEDILRKFYRYYSDGIPIYDDELKPLSSYIKDSINKLIEHGFIDEELNVTEGGRKFSEFINNEVMSVKEIEAYFPEKVREKNTEKLDVVVDCDGVTISIKKGDVTVMPVFSVPLSNLELYFKLNPDKLMDFVEFNNDLIKKSLSKK